MSAYFEEVIDAHVVIENWLGRKEGSAEALMARFTPILRWSPPVVPGWTIQRSATFSSRPAAAARA